MSKFTILVIFHDDCEIDTKAFHKNAQYIITM